MTTFESAPKSRVEVNEFGVWRIPLTEDSLNTAGHLEVDGDEFETGPCAILRFKLVSDGPDGDGMVDFGTFRVNLAGVGTVEGSCILTTPDAHALMAALEAHVGPAAPPSPEQEGPNG